MFKSIIFVTYINRSGSTFLVNNLSKSADILVCPEAEILIDLFLNSPAEPFNPDKNFSDKLLNAIKKDTKLKYWGLSEEDIVYDITRGMNCFDAFIKVIETYKRKVKPQSNTLVFKAEKLIFFYNRIHPLTRSYNIKFVSITRDCRAIFYSQNHIFIPETNQLMETNSLRLAKRWNTFIRLAEKYSKNDDFITVSYESLINDFNNYFKFVCEKLDIKPIKTKNKGDLWLRMPASHLTIHNCMENAPEIEKINLWHDKISPDHLYILELVSRKLLVHNGYKLAHDSKYSIKTFMVFIIEYLSFMFTRIKKAIMYRLIS
jgi:hypothetical protein